MLALLSIELKPMTVPNISNRIQTVSLTIMFILYNTCNNTCSYHRITGNMYRYRPFKQHNKSEKKNYLHQFFVFFSLLSTLHIVLTLKMCLLCSAGLIEISALKENELTLHFTGLPVFKLHFVIILLNILYIFWAPCFISYMYDVQIPPCLPDYLPHPT